MDILEILKEDLKDLKLEKRTLLLAGKNTKEIDIKIKEIEEKLKQGINN